jgi:uncharacterized membrane protein YoaK (UPF0700 family)
VKVVAVMAAAQFVQYVVLTINFRSIAHGMYAAAGLSAASASVIGALLSRKVARENDERKTRLAILGMMVGGACADMLGIWLTRGWGQ